MNYLDNLYYLCIFVSNNINTMEINKNTIIPITDPLLRLSIYNAFDGKCFYTGRCLDFNEMHIDHIKPKAKGGLDCIENYVLSSGYINRKKSSIHSEKFESITKELINLIFVDNVISEYENLYINNRIREGYEHVKQFAIRQNYLNTNGSYLQFIAYIYNCKKYTPLKIKPIRSNGKKAKRNDIYYKKDDLIKAFDYWHNKNKRV